MKTTDIIKTLKNNASQPPPLHGDYILYDNGSRIPLLESSARELIAKHYGTESEFIKTFPHCDGGTLSLGTNQCLKFEEHRIGVAGAIPHWPCPNGCLNWCRTDGSMTNHHPRCEFVDESLIDVWKVSDGSSSYYDTDEAAARHEAEGCDDITITKVKMHREIYDNLPEFQGF